MDVILTRSPVDSPVLHLWQDRHQTMPKPPRLTSNFAHLQEHDAQLLRLGMLAERYFPDDPNT